MAFSSLLDEPVVRERAMRFTIEQYHQFGEAGLVGKNVELLEGIVVKKMSKSRPRKLRRACARWFNPGG